RGRKMIKIHGKTPPFLLKGEKLIHVVHGVSIGESEDFNLQTNQGDLYLTNMRVIFYGDPGTLSQILNTSEEEEVFGGFSIFYENIEDVSIGGLMEKHLEIKYPKESRWSVFKSDKIAIRGMDTDDMGRLIRLIKNYKQMGLKPIPLTVVDRAQLDEDELISQDIIMAKAKATTKQVGVSKAKGKTGVSLSEKLSQMMKEREEAKKRKMEEEFKKTPPGYVLSETVELVCPACGSTVAVEPGMDTCPYCKKRVNFLTGKVLDK
ncbi:MAG: hypothetical protein ACTSRV_13915, partial [Candidatus Freyarchaeota archaeon]